MIKLSRRVLCLDWDKRSLRIVVARVGKGRTVLEDAHSHRLPHTVDADDPQAMFFTIWTLKESYLKAEGQGFSVSPKTFCIVPDGDSAAFQGETAYHFRSVPAPDGYRLSVCARESEITDHVVFRSF